MKLVLIGDGPQKEYLEQLVNVDGDYILLTGWKSYEELPLWYQSALALVLPSTFEPWGLVVNEALAAGTRVVASNACGCMEDLLIKYQNSVFDPYDMNSLIEVLDGLDRHKKTNANSIDDNFTCNNWAINLTCIIA